MHHMTQRVPLKDRITRNVTVDDNGCWLWQRRTGRDGYGLMWIKEGGRQWLRFAHRIAYTEWVGPIPEGLQLDHLCRVRACCNPSHLAPVTSRANTHAPGSQAPAALNAAKVECPKGHPLVVKHYPKGTRRDCPVCQRESSRKYRARRRAMCYQP